MIVSIHQPNYLPYLGFFDKMRKSDVFVIYDDAQFNKGDFQHRNKIRIKEGWKWLTVPVEKEHKPINEIKIRDEVMWKGLKWSEDHFKNIKENYEETPYYSNYEDELKRIYSKNYEKLVDLNMEIIEFLKKSFDINTRMVFSSTLGLDSKASDRLAETVEALDGDIYLSGPMGRNYLDIKLFEERNIQVQFQEFDHPIYRQKYKDFYPNMAAIDALFNVGRMPE